MTTVICRFIVSSKVKGHPYLNTNFPCEKQEKYKATFLDPINSKSKTEFVCGSHKNKLIAWAERIKSKTGFDTNIKIETINPTI